MPVSDNKRLCQSVDGGKETENKLLLQISEAEQVSDFERILNSNAILWGRAHRHVWRGGIATYTPAASVVTRPRSSYSLQTVSQAYHYLYRQHEESLQPLIDRYRQTADEQTSRPPPSLLGNNWYENLQDLSEFYDEDYALREEIETITDRIITEEVKSEEVTQQRSGRNKNFNVNLAGLIGLHVNGEGFSPIPTRDEFASSDVEKGDDNDSDEDKEWLAPIMSANSDDRQNSNQNDTSVERLAQNLNSIQIDSDGKVPTITFSNCCDGCDRSDIPNNTDVDIHLAVPSIDSIDESRPPMM